jgi:hypothetical protein
VRLINQSNDGRYFQFNDRPADIVCAEFTRKKDCKSVTLADELAEHDLILFRESYGYRLTDIEEELNVHFKNLVDLELFMKRFLK